MITQLPQSHDAVLGFEVKGKVSEAQEKEWIEKLDASITQHGKISVLIILDEQAGWGFKAGVEDLKWVMAHMKNLNKIAVVSTSAVWKWLVTLDGFFAQFMGIGEKHFEAADLESAWKWINQA